jgi:predicted transcriptional regulator YdeE
MSLETMAFGPVRAIGVRYAGKNENQEIMKLWGEFIPRSAEIAKPEGGGAFGICRCLPGVKDGSFEYIAAFQALPDAPVPEGMMAVEIAPGEYFVERYERVADYKQAWQESAGKLAADTEWTGYCNGPDDCQCAAHPCFEYYPPEFNGTGPMHIYLPVHRKQGG